MVEVNKNGRGGLRLWLQLITLTTVVEKKIRRNLKSEFKTTLPRFDILATLERAGKKMTMGDLTKKLLVSKGNVTGVVASLVKQGLLRRVRDEDDKRTHYLSLTARGRKEFTEQAKAHQGWINDYFSGLESGELSAMVDQLSKLKDTISKNQKGKAS
ncbi:MAG: MarR family winged helix-turn-helix transcriptional regulator [Alphaproteobacteria bacterium]